MAEKSFLPKMGKPDDKTDEELLKTSSGAPDKSKAKEEGDTTRINIFIPKELHRRIKGLAVIRGVTMNELLVEIIDGNVSQVL